MQIWARTDPHAGSVLYWIVLSPKLAIAIYRDERVFVHTTRNQVTKTIWALKAAPSTWKLIHGRTR